MNRESFFKSRARQAVEKVDTLNGPAIFIHDKMGKLYHWISLPVQCGGTFGTAQTRYRLLRSVPFSEIRPILTDQAQSKKIRLPRGGYWYEVEKLIVLRVEVRDPPAI